MTITAKDLAELSEQLAGMQRGLESQGKAHTSLMSFLRTVESTLAGAAEDIGEALRLDHAGDAAAVIAKALAELELKVTVQAGANTINLPELSPTINLPELRPTIVVQPAETAAAPQWKTLTIKPVRNTRTGEAEQYTVTRN